MVVVLADAEVADDCPLRVEGSMLLPAGVDPAYVATYGPVQGNAIRGVEMHLGARCASARCARSVQLETWGFRLDDAERGQHDLLRALELRRSEVTERRLAFGEIQLAVD